MYKDKIRKLKTNLSFAEKGGKSSAKKQNKTKTLRINDQKDREIRKWFGGCVMRL